MKLRPFIILLLFVVSLGVLAWMYYTAFHNHSKRRHSPWHDTLTQLGECGRAKHTKAMLYTQFAAVAENESETGAAQLFRAMAYSEQVHEQNCIEAIRRLGGQYTPPQPVAVFNGKTDDNLLRSLAFEQKLHKSLRKSDADLAMQAGNRYAARILIWSDGSDLQHICLLERCKCDSLSPDGYLVCATCGNLYRSDMAPHYCPFCLVGSDQFVRF